MRGPDPTETLVDIDGHPVNNGNTGDFDLSLIDPAALQDVQMLYGISPSSLIGPNTIGGGINIVTLEPSLTPHSLVRVYGGSYGTFGGTIQATGTDDRFGYALSLHGTTSNGSVNQTILAPPAGRHAPMTTSLRRSEAVPLAIPCWRSFGISWGARTDTVICSSTSATRRCRKTSRHC